MQPEIAYNIEDVRTLAGMVAEVASGLATKEQSFEKMKEDFDIIIGHMDEIEAAMLVLSVRNLIETNKGV